MADEMIIDIPKIKTYLSQIISPLVSDELDNPVQVVYEACEGILEQRLCSEMLAEVLQSASTRLGQPLVCGLVKKANLSLRDLLAGYSGAAFDEFVKKSALEWALNSAHAVVPEKRERTQSASVSQSSGAAGAPLDAHEKALNEIFAACGQDNEAVEARIGKQFSAAELQSKLFVRALVISVCRSCHQEKFDLQLFKHRSSLLHKYIGKREEMELEALFAIQALDHRMKHLPGMCHQSCRFY